MKKVFAVTAVIALLGLSIAAQAVEIETVPVGNPGNAADTLTGFGSVAYEYRIGRYEVTTGQYTAFLNAKARVSDMYGLYDGWMGGITRGGSPGNYTYSVASDFVNRPVTQVSFWDACRFANWLNNGQGAGNTEIGAYSLDGYNGIDGRTKQRDAGAKWAVTSEDEWYKAAYDKKDGVSGNYWLYPTNSDTAPGRDMADVSRNNANYYGTPYPIDSPYYTTVAGEFQNSASPYGTFDQGGNVFEWTESSIIDPVSDFAFRVVRGGSYVDYNYSDSLAAWYRAMATPSNGQSRVGFRVSQVSGFEVPVPEPSSLLALGMGVVGLAGFIRRRM